MKKITFFILLLTMSFVVFSQTVSLTVESGASLTVESGASLTLSSNAILTNDGTITIVDGGTVTLKSDVNGSAFIDEGTGTFTGDFTIERFIPERRAFRLLSSPVTTDDFIANNWQLDTHITGVAGAANGFDPTATNNPSMFTYDNSNETWSPVTNTTGTNLINGTPYRIMVRGDRGTDLTDNAATPSDVTLSASGTLDAENTVPTALTLNETIGGFSLVANPFQAPVDMNTILTTNNVNINPEYYWIWDPTINVRGGYVTIDIDAVPATETEPNKYLQAGQSAFVETIVASSASITFTQASKNTATSETETFKSSNSKKTTSKLHLSLYETNALVENRAVADRLLIFFDDSFSTLVNFRDASKLTNLDETFATSNSGKLLSIEKRTTPNITDVIPLTITRYRHSNYTIVAEGSAMQGETAFLYDGYTDEYTEIPQNGTVNYAYSINTYIAASIASDRFSIKFSATSLSVPSLEISKIHLYPNPVSDGFLYLNVPKEMDDLELTIYNALGAKLFSKTEFKSGSKAQINTDFAKGNGLYFVELSSNGQTITKKIIID